MELGVEEPSREEWQFEGLHYPADLSWNMWNEHRKHGTLMIAGGYLDQPPEFWDMIHTLNALFGTAITDEQKEQKRKKKK